MHNVIDDVLRSKAMMRSCVSIHINIVHLSWFNKYFVGHFIFISVGFLDIYFQSYYYSTDRQDYGNTFTYFV